MKRLSVRLSVVGAILALGAAAIAHSVLSKSDETDVKQKVAQASPDKSVEPIQGASDQETSPLPQPPPASAFTRSGGLRTVSHEEGPSAGASDAARSADAIPTAEPSDAGSSPASEFAPPSPTYGNLPGSSGASYAGSSTIGSGPSAASRYGLPSSTAGGASVGGGTGHLPAVPSMGDRPSANGEPAAPSSDQFPATETAQAPGGPASGTSHQFPTAGYPAQPYPNTASANGTARDNSFPAAPGRGETTQGAPSDPTADAGPGAGSFRPRLPRAGPSSVGGSLAAGAAGGAIGGMLTKPSFGTASASSTPTDPSAVADGSTSTGIDRSATPGDPSTSSVYPSTTEQNPATYPTSSDTAASSTSSSSTMPDGPTVPSTTMPSSYGQSAPATNSLPVVGGLPAASTGVATGVAAALVSDLPGDRKLEGQQAPAIVLEKTAPEEIQVDRKATFQVRVRNAGNAPAHNVTIVDRVPRGTEFLDAVPPCSATPDGILVWDLQTIKPGHEVTLSINLMPKVAGEIGSVAQATFQTQASVRTICTKPQLKLDLKVQEKVLIGRTATMDITITNTGNGAATSVVLEEDVPEGFAHAAGRELEQEIGTLQPQESRRLTLVLDSVKPGVYKNRLSVRGDANLADEDIREIEVTTPKIQLEMTGPTLRYLDRKATYTIRLANPGTASARSVEMVAYLPKGMKYLTSDNHGQYDTQTHAVYWSLEELPAGKQGDVHLTVLPIEPGVQKLKADCRANLGLKETVEHQVTVEGLAQLVFTVTDIADPIEVGSDTTYVIKVQNRGSKADTAIQLIAELPAGIVPTTGDGPSQAAVRGQQVIFEPLARLGPNEEAAYRIHARGTTTGDHVIRVQLKSAELRVPVTKEESTRVYTDK